MRYAGLMGVVLWVFAFPSGAQTFEYADLIYPKSTLTIDANARSPQVAVGDVARAAVVCSDGAMVCIVSDVFAFAIPLKLDHSVNHWSYSGREYDLESIGRIAALGLFDDRVLRVRSTYAGTTYLYAYSARRGLVAVQVNSSNGVRTFVSTTGVGFGAAVQDLRR